MFENDTVPIFVLKIVNIFLEVMYINVTQGPDQAPEYANIGT